MQDTLSPERAVAGLAARGSWAYVALSVFLLAGFLVMTPLLLSYELDLIGWFAALAGPLIGLCATLRTAVFRVIFDQRGVTYRNLLGISTEYTYDDLERAVDRDGNLDMVVRGVGTIKIYGIEADIPEIKRSLEAHGVVLVDGSAPGA